MIGAIHRSGFRRVTRTREDGETESTAGRCRKQAAPILGAACVLVFRERIAERAPISMSRPSEAATSHRRAAPNMRLVALATGYFRRLAPRGTGLLTVHRMHGPIRKRSIEQPDGPTVFPGRDDQQSRESGESPPRL